MYILKCYVWMTSFLLSLAFNCSNVSFSVERNSLIKGKLLKTESVDSLASCTKLCSQIDDCDSFNFILDSDKQSHCLAINSKKNSSADVSALLPGAILFSGSKICLQDSSCLRRSFAFERWPARRPSDPADILEKITCSLDECRHRCLQNKNCLSVAYKKTTNTCLLSSISVNYVYNARKSYFSDENYDLYENNCQAVPISETSCSWMRIKSAGLPELYDSKIKAENAEHCEHMCLQRSVQDDICRSYTFDSSTSTCLLSHTSSRLSGRSPLEFHNKYLTHGDLDDCMDLSLKCRLDNLVVEGKTMRQFSGNLKTKKGKEILCQSDIKKSFQFTSKFDYHKCGLAQVQEPLDAFHGVVHLKEGSTSLVTIRDKVLQVECRIHPQVEKTEQTLSVAMNVTDSANSRLLSDKVIILPKASSPPKPKYTLSVLSENGRKADKIRIGEKAWIRIKLNSPSPGNFLVTKVIAKDTRNNKSVELVDAEGCVSVSRSVIDLITINSTSSEISYRLNVGAFDHESELIYQAYVVSCGQNCQPKCNMELIKEDKALIRSALVPIVTRLRRSLAPRQIELSQDIYKVYGNRFQVISDDNTTVQKISPDYIERSPYNSLELSLKRCMIDDTTCLFTAILGLVQIILLVACIIIIYCYFLQWRNYRAAQLAINPSGQTQIQHTFK